MKIQEEFCPKKTEIGGFHLFFSDEHDKIHVLFQGFFVINFELTSGMIITLSLCKN